MPISGSQRYLRVGSRAHFRRDAIAGVIQPMLDFGTIKTVNPTQNVQTVDLYDGDGGSNTLVASSVARFDETYDIVFNNFDNNNMAFLFSSTPPENYTVSAATVTANQIHGGAGSLLKLQDANGAFVYDLDDIVGFYFASDLQGTITDIDATAGTITVTQDLSALPNGSHVIVGPTGLSDPTNAGTYEVASTSGTGPTTITINPAVHQLESDETAITGILVGSTIDGAIFKYKTDWDLDTHSLRRGYVRILSASALTTPGTVSGVYVSKAISGKRLMKPQTVSEVQGQLIVYFSSDNYDTEFVREARATITPGGSNLRVDDWSEATLSVKLITDLLATEPSGRLLQTVGAIPTIA